MSDGPGPIRVLLVDDQPLLRSGFSMILSTESDMEVVGTAENGQRAVEEVTRLRPDVVLMDVQMPVLDGIEATQRIVALAVDAGEAPPKIVILTTFDRDDYLFDALTAGASGFLLKNADAEHLVEGIRTVHGGLALLAPEVTQRVIAAAHQRPHATHGAPAQPVTPEPGTPTRADGLLTELTARESEVLALMATGLSNAEIASSLFLSEATVKTHVSNVLTKLGVRDRVQAVIAAYRSGLVPPSG
ncbi:MAG: response regulator transcription factor [Ornithinimicrobium sp.]